LGVRASFGEERREVLVERCGGVEAGAELSTDGVGLDEGALRRLGLVLSGRPGDAEHVSRVLAERVELALAAQQQSALLRLRAVQARLFVRAVRSHVVGTEPSQELHALGGEFVGRAAKNGWLGADGFVGSEDELRALFVMRWSQLTRLREDPALSPSLAELRRYYRFLLLYPEHTPGRDALAVERAQLRLRYAGALARHDRDYPLDLARGCLFAQIGSGPESAQAFGGYLAGSSAGEWKVRARNHLLHAAQGHGEDL
jgi:hypothetical protein